MLASVLLLLCYGCYHKDFKAPAPVVYILDIIVTTSYCLAYLHCN